jgi:hypothetical protein
LSEDVLATKLSVGQSGRFQLNNTDRRTIVLKVDKHNRFTLTYRAAGSSRWRDVREPRSLWGNLNKREFENALAQYVADLRAAGHDVVFQGRVAEALGYCDPIVVARTREQLVRNLRSLARGLWREPSPVDPDAQARAAERLSLFARDVERAPDALIRRIVAATHDEAYRAIWTTCCAAASRGALKDGAHLLNAVASACTPWL